MANRFSVKIYDENNTLVPAYEAVEGRGAEVYAYEWGVQIPIDSSTGKVTGQREYTPVKIVKEVCKASPVIFQKLTQGKKLKKVEIFGWRHDPINGQETQYYTVTLEDLTVVKLGQSLLDTTQEMTKAVPALETITFVAEKFTQVFVEGNIAYTDEYREKGKKVA